MDLEPVDSSAILRVAYTESDGTLVIEFPSRNLCFYSNVPMDVYADFLNSESMGRFYNQRIKGQFKSVTIPAEKRDDYDPSNHDI